MRRNAVLYGAVVILDAQKRQMNASGWAYVGPCIKNSEFLPRVAAESLHVQEDAETYRWVLLTMSQLEPRFELSNIKIIFGDEGIPDSLPGMLGITAPIVGDYYHLFEVVFPAKFGPQIYPQLEEFLKAMWYSKTKSDWDTAYGKACSHSLVRNRPLYLEFLQRIHDRPTRYAGFYRLSIPGNMKLNGSVSAEQNHSSISARIGKGGIMPLAENAVELLKRQQDIVREDSKKVLDHYQAREVFKSKYKEPAHAAIDTEAFKCLSLYAYNKLFKDMHKLSRRLAATRPALYPQHVFVHSKDMDVTAFTMAQARRHDKVTVLEVGGPCECSMKVSYGLQCGHELVAQGAFNPEFWAMRWKSQHYLSELGDEDDWQRLFETDFDYNVDDFGASTSGATPQDGDASAPGHDTPHGWNSHLLSPSAGSMRDIGSPESVSKLPARDRGGSLTYHGLMRQATELVRSVQNDKMGSTAVAMAFQKMQQCVRENNRYFKVQVTVPEASRTRDPITGTRLVDNTQEAVSATSRAIRNTSNIQRKRPAVEVARGSSQRQHKSARKQSMESDRVHVGGKKKHMGKACSLCRSEGHKVGNCPKITKYGHAPLPLNRVSKDRALDERNRLANSLERKDTYITEPRDLQQKSLPVFDSVPVNRVKGIVLLARLYMFTPFGVEPDSPGNYCFQATVIGEGGDPHERFDRCLFESKAIRRYVLRGNSQLIVNAMELQTVTRPTRVASPLNIPPPFAGIHQAGGGLDDSAGLSPTSPLSRGTLWNELNSLPDTYTRNGNTFGKM